MRLYKNTTPANVVTLEEAKAQLYVLSTRDDVYIQSLINIAHDVVEDFTNLRVSTAEYTWIENQVCGYLAFPRWPIRSIANIASINVKDEYDSTQRELVKGTDYYVEDNYIKFVEEKVYFEATIIFSAGYTSTSLPSQLKQAILLLVGSYYANRQDDTMVGKLDSLPMGFNALTRNLRYDTA